MKHEADLDRQLRDRQFPTLIKVGLIEAGEPANRLAGVFGFPTLIKVGLIEAAKSMRASMEAEMFPTLIKVGLIEAAQES